MAQCPSEGWESYERDQERSECPTDAEMLEGLDAYGHLSWTVGFDNEERGDWLACCDFEVFNHPERGVLVAYHVVVNSDTGGFIDTLEARVVEADKAPKDLPDYWAGIAVDHGGMTDDDLEAAGEINREWNEALKIALASAKED
jgi:hypothetical protein